MNENKHKFETIDNYRKTPFSRWNKVNISQQVFDENPKIKISGQWVNLREYTNKNAEDTEIYPTMEKYNGDLKMTQERLLQNYNKIDEKLSEITSLTDAHKKINEAEKLWNELPLQVRQIFNYSSKEFAQNGAKYAQQEIIKHNNRIKELKEKQRLEREKWEAEQKLKNIQA